MCISFSASQFLFAEFLLSCNVGCWIVSVVAVIGYRNHESMIEMHFKIEKENERHTHAHTHNKYTRKIRPCRA